MNYCSLVNVNIRHDYFMDGLCRNINIIPTEATQILLARNDLLFRKLNSGFTLLRDIESTVGADENLLLSFKVYSVDPYFSVYTQEFTEFLPPLFFHIEHDSTENIGPQNTCLLPHPLQEEQQFLRIKSAVPHFVIDISLDVSSVDNFSGETKVHNINFHARKLHWKYYFFGEYTQTDLEIYDVNGQSPIMFDLCNELVAKKGMAYLSREEILMSEASIQRFQLKDKNNSGKVLIKRLPNANVQLLGKGRTSSGQSVLVAEIYINQ
jgi:hypothetical protein